MNRYEWCPRCGGLCIYFADTLFRNGYYRVWDCYECGIEFKGGKVK